MTCTRHRDGEERQVPDRDRVRHRPGSEHGADARSSSRRPRPATALYVRFDATVNGNGGGGAGERRRRLGARSTSRRDTPSSSRPIPSPRRTRRTATTRSRSTPPSTAPFSEATSGFVGGRERRPRPARRRRTRLTTTVRRRARRQRRPDGARRRCARREGRARARLRRLAGRGRRRRRRRSLAGGFAETRAAYVKGWKRLRQAADEAAHGEAAGHQAQRREAARGRVLPQRQRDQGVRGQDVPRRDRRQPRLAVGPGRLAPAIPANTYFGSYREVFARDLYESWTGLRRRRRPGDGARRDAVPVRAPAAAGRLDAAQQPRQRQGRARLLRHAARRDRLPDPDGASARARPMRALYTDHIKPRGELRRRARPVVRRRALGGAERLLAVDDRGRDRRARGRGRDRARERRRSLGRGLARRGGFDFQRSGQELDGDDDRAARDRATSFGSRRRATRTRRSPTTSATAGRRSTSAR